MVYSDGDRRKDTCISFKTFQSFFFSQDYGRVHAQYFADHHVQVLHLGDDVIAKVVSSGREVVDLCLQFLLHVLVGSQQVSGEAEQRVGRFVASQEKLNPLKKREGGR